MIEIPVLSSEAGLCLTAQNWESLDLEYVAYTLIELLQKPGIEGLMTSPSLGALIGWQRKHVLNASMPKMDANGSYLIYSRYDGRRIVVSVQQILDVIIALMPDLVILPHGFYSFDQTLWLKIPQKTHVFFPDTDRPMTQTVRPFGVSVTSTQPLDWQGINDTIYVIGNVSLAQREIFRSLGVSYLENDQPAKDAFSGKVYTRAGICDLTEPAYATQFDVIEKSCGCPTCQAALTRAYLHHLLQHTPLLCQRFLIQHNHAHLPMHKLSL